MGEFKLAHGSVFRGKLCEMPRPDFHVGLKRRRHQHEPTLEAINGNQQTRRKYSDNKDS